MGNIPQSRSKNKGYFGNEFPISSKSEKSLPIKIDISN